MPDLSLLILGAVLGGLVNGLSGFGFAIMALGVWQLFLPLTLAGPLMVASIIGSNLQALPRVWPHINLRHTAPFVAGGLLGVPLGVALLILFWSGYPTPEFWRLAMVSVPLPAAAAWVGVQILYAARRDAISGDGDGHSRGLWPVHFGELASLAIHFLLTILTKISPHTLHVRTLLTISTYA